MSSSSEHNIIDSLLAFEAKAAQKTPLDRLCASMTGALRTSTSSAAQTCLDETSLDCARVHKDAQRSAKIAYKSRPATKWPMPEADQK